jgi:hypothetical protein
MSSNIPSIPSIPPPLEYVPSNQYEYVDEHKHEHDIEQYPNSSCFTFDHLFVYLLEQIGYRGAQGCSLLQLWKITEQYLNEHSQEKLDENMKKYIWNVLLQNEHLLFYHPMNESEIEIEKHKQIEKLKTDKPKQHSNSKNKQPPKITLVNILYKQIKQMEIDKG